MKEQTEWQQYISRLDESGWWNNPARLSEEQRRERVVEVIKKEGCDFNVYGGIQIMEKIP